jgi:hypothetical protein
MAYKITAYHRRQAKKLGVKIKPSTRKNKKIDVFDKQGKYITSIGLEPYQDYQRYIRTRGKKFAEERRRLYKIRHKKESKRPGTRGYYSFFILW